MNHNEHKEHREHWDRHVDFVVVLKLEEIKYDIKFDTWLREKIINAELRNANKDADKISYAYSDDKAEDWLIRQIDTAINNIRSEINWAVVEYGNTDSNEIKTNPTEWAIQFHFSPAWRGSLRAMKTAMHKYVCEYVLSQWYRASMPRGSEKYEIEAYSWLNKLYNEARSEVYQPTPWNL